MNRYKKLLRNSAIFAIGNLGSKVISLLLIPLYTYYLTTDQYGTVDLITTTLGLLIPIFTMSIYDAVLRFVMDKSYNKKKILNNALILTLVGFFVAILMYPVFNIIFPFSNVMNYFYIFLFTQSINSSLLQFVRAIDKVKLFALAGIISAFVVLIGNLIFLMIMGWGIRGYLISLVSADIVSCILMCWGAKIYNYFSFHEIDLNLLKKMLLYSMPLIPNALMWWVMGLSDRYIITYFIGIGANGLYAVANKIPNILNMINSIFFQAWQMSAIEEASSNSKSMFYTKVFGVFSATMLVFTSLFLVFLKLVMRLFLSVNYFEAWRYVPFLLLGVVFSSFSGFLGTNYIASKNTVGVFRTSLIGAVINLIANLCLVPTIGTNGASISTLLSFAIIWVLRIIETKSFVTIDINIKKLVSTLLIILIQIGILYLNLLNEFLYQLVLLLIVVILNRKELKIIALTIIFKAFKKG